MFKDECRTRPRRRTYLGEGLTFELGGRIEAEAIDLTSGGLGLVLRPIAEVPAAGDTIRVRYTGRGASGEAQDAVVRHVGSLRGQTRLGVSLVHDAPAAAELRWPAALPACASAACPWFFQETLRFRIAAAGAAGITLRGTAPLPPRARLDLDLHLADVGIERARGRVRAVHGDEIDVAWIDPPPRLLSRFLLAGDETLTPAELRAGGLPVGSVAGEVSYEYAGSDGELREILALRLRAHQADGHLARGTAADLRSPFDSHSRHLTCRFGGRVVGYVRVIFVDGDPERSQYVSWGGHEVPQWLWDAGFVEAGAGAVHPDFQRAGLFVPLMQHAYRVAVQSGHRYVLGACDDDLLGMYGEMGFETLESRIVEPKPGWRFRSHLIYVDTERVLDASSPSRTLSAMASAIEFATPSTSARRPAAVAATA
jgi:GNAT superfamily N-acetyltransferase